MSADISDGDGGPAFPHVEPTPNCSWVAPGMSLRDWFAGQALAGLLAKQGFLVAENRNVVSDCYLLADRMLSRRSR